MQFYSFMFIFFIAAALLIYYIPLVRKKSLQWIVLLAASLFYYKAMGGTKALVFIVFTALTTWFSSILFFQINTKISGLRKNVKDLKQRKKAKALYQLHKRIILIGVLLLNFGILAYLKYWNFLAQSFFHGKGLSTLILPLGISFYTFQSISYVIDTFNNKYEYEHNFAKYLLFVSFFPQIIQGPINRFDLLGHQLSEQHSFSKNSFSKGLLRIEYGLLKKYSIANLLSPMIAALFDARIENIPGSAVVFGILLYSAQQYADFSGGIDIVIGVAELFDIHMSENFKQPYFSTSLGDFWRRWHITLGTWMRDYVFYPIALTKGMNKLGKYMTKHWGKHAGRTLPACIANIIVFLIVGIWHGAEEHYITWGLYNGLVIALSDLFAPVFAGLAKKLHMNTESGKFHVFRIIRTFIIVNIGWYFDRIYDLSYRNLCFKNTFARFQLHAGVELVRNLPVSFIKESVIVAFIGCLIVFVISFLKEKGKDVIGNIEKLHSWQASGIIAAGCVFILISFLYQTVPGGFMYANF